MRPFTPPRPILSYARAAPCRAALRDDGLVAELIRSGGLFGDFSLERWLDRLEMPEDRR
ncbi:hypothetical protein ACRDNQ_01475 [Palleronia sp. KMU-117]|uniref:hypothetical protein n=1 Tax=Palleronia sp. KMU-117 TaxID=3434108 RepID=UPI003D72F949